MKSRLLLILVSFLCFTSITAQTLKTYTGPYPDGRNSNWRGRATYSYKEDELGQRIYEGPCTYSTKDNFGLDTAKGQFKNDEKDGRWVYISKGGYTQTVIANYKNGLYDGAYSFEEKDSKTGRINRSVKATFRNDGLVGSLVYMNGSDTYVKGQYDDQGRKQGKWEHQYRGEVKYTFLFKDDVCTKGIKMDLQTGDVSDARFSAVEDYWEFQRHYSLENMIHRSRYHSWGLGGDGRKELARKPLDANDKDEEFNSMSANEAMRLYLEKKLQYPKEAEEKGIQGRVTLLVAVDTDGSIKSIDVEKGIEPSLDAEAKRVVGSMPKWILSELSHKAVEGKIQIPVVFRLQ